MSVPNYNWPRWIFASISKHFSDKAVIASLPIFIEGQTRAPSENNDYIEFRFDGPSMQEVSRNYWSIDVEVNIMIVSFINEEDLHKIHRNIGLVCSFFTCIPIMRYGDDRTSLVGIMDTVQEGRERLIVTNYGQVQSDSRMLQATVEAMYHFNVSL